MSFESFEIDSTLLAGVRDLGFEQPTDIQQDAIPWGLEGRDVLACAMTGSGKTAAFGLPILQRLLHRPRGVTRALILSPTRELASQIDDHLRQLGVHTGLRVAPIYGGVAYEPQEKAFREGYEILVATPGRLLDHLRRPYARLDHLEVLVLDEADRMLDMGFIPDVRRILHKVPAERQTMLFSATLPQPIVRLANDMLVDPATINLERRAAPAEGVRQAAYPVRHELKPALLLHLLGRHPVDSALVFTRTRERADQVGEFLRRAQVAAAVIHGDRTQQHRTHAMDAFKRGDYRVLVATDVAARGIDIEELDLVVNLDVPSSPDDYIHRVGRTARAGSTGDAWTFVAARELADLHLIEKSIGQKIPRVRLEDFDYSPSPSPSRSAPAPATAAVAPAGGTARAAGDAARSRAVGVAAVAEAEPEAAAASAPAPPAVAVPMERAAGEPRRPVPAEASRFAGGRGGRGGAGAGGAEPGGSEVDAERRPAAPAARRHPTGPEAVREEAPPARRGERAAATPITGGAAPARRPEEPSAAPDPWIERYRRLRERRAGESPGRDAGAPAVETGDRRAARAVPPPGDRRGGAPSPRRAEEPRPPRARRPEPGPEAAAVERFAALRARRGRRDDGR